MSPTTLTTEAPLRADTAANFLRLVTAIGPPIRLTKLSGPLRPRDLPSHVAGQPGHQVRGFFDRAVQPTAVQA